MEDFFRFSQNIQTLTTKLIYVFFSVSFKKKEKNPTVVCCIYCYIIKTMHFEHTQGLFFCRFLQLFCCAKLMLTGLFVKTLNSFKFYSAVSKLLKPLY